MGAGRRLPPLPPVVTPLYTSMMLLTDCRRNPDVCDLNARCLRRGAEYFCVCIPGYQGDGYDQCTSKSVQNNAL